MTVEETQAQILMNRSATPWLSFSDWEMGLARDLPWQIYISTHLGQVNIDLSELILQEAVISTGFGDLRCICPFEALGPMHLRSALGTIQVVTPVGYRTQISVDQSLFFGVSCR